MPQPVKSSKPAFLKKIVGMPGKEAQMIAATDGFQFRVTKLDGKGLMGTCDYRTDRVNVWISDEVITKAYIG